MTASEGVLNGRIALVTGGGPASVGVNAIAPGVTRTAMIEELIIGRGAEAMDAITATVPLGRLAEPHQIAEAALWLTSPASNFVTGQVLTVDGGFTAQ